MDYSELCNIAGQFSLRAIPQTEKMAATRIVGFAGSRRDTKEFASEVIDRLKSEYPMAASWVASPLHGSDYEDYICFLTREGQEQEVEW